MRKGDQIVTARWDNTTLVLPLVRLLRGHLGIHTNPANGDNLESIPFVVRPKTEISEEGKTKTYLAVWPIELDHGQED